MLRVLAPVTVKADVFTEFVMAAVDAIEREPNVTVPEYCKSRVPPALRFTAPVPVELVPAAASVPAVIVVPPLYVLLPDKRIVVVSPIPPLMVSA